MCVISIWAAVLFVETSWMLMIRCVYWRIVYWIISRKWFHVGIDCLICDIFILCRCPDNGSCVVDGCTFGDENVDGMEVLCGLCAVAIFIMLL